MVNLHGEQSNLKEFQNQELMVVRYRRSLLYSTSKDGLQGILVNVGEEPEASL